MNGIWQDGQFVLASTFEERLERSNALLKQSEARARELFEAIAKALETLPEMPCGAIGPNGATLEELNAAAEQGHFLEDDPVYDISQRIYRILEAATEETEKERIK